MIVLIVLIDVYRRDLSTSFKRIYGYGWAIGHVEDKNKLKQTSGDVRLVRLYTAYVEIYKKNTTYVVASIPHLITSFLSEQRTAKSTRSRQEKDANLSGS